MSKILSRPEAGYTLFEILIVFSLIGILSAVSALSVAFYVPNLRLKSAVHEIDLQIRKARLEAIRSGRSYHVEFHKAVDGEICSPVIWVDQDEDGTMDNGEIVSKMVVESVPAPHVWEFERFGGIRYDDTQGANGVKNFTGDKFVLNRRGLSDDDGSIHLLNNRGKKKTILVTLGGAVRVY